MTEERKNELRAEQRRILQTVIEGGDTSQLPPQARAYLPWFKEFPDGGSTSISGAEGRGKGEARRRKVEGREEPPRTSRSKSKRGAGRVFISIRPAPLII
jgi:hypothetical protein